MCGGEFCIFAAKIQSDEYYGNKENYNKRDEEGAEGGRGRERKANWCEYTATVDDIQSFLIDRVMLRHNVVTG